MQSLQCVCVSVGQITTLLPRHFVWWFVLTVSILRVDRVRKSRQYYSAYVFQRRRDPATDASSFSDKHLAARTLSTRSRQVKFDNAASQAKRQRQIWPTPVINRRRVSCCYNSIIGDDVLLHTITSLSLALFLLPAAAAAGVCQHWRLYGYAFDICCYLSGSAFEVGMFIHALGSPPWFRLLRGLRYCKSQVFTYLTYSCSSVNQSVSPSVSELTHGASLILSRNYTTLRLNNGHFQFCCNFAKMLTYFRFFIIKLSSKFVI